MCHVVANNYAHLQPTIKGVRSRHRNTEQYYPLSNLNLARSQFAFIVLFCFCCLKCKIVTLGCSWINLVKSVNGWINSGSLIFDFASNLWHQICFIKEIKSPYGKLLEGKKEKKWKLNKIKRQMWSFLKLSLLLFRFFSFFYGWHVSSVWSDQNQQTKLPFSFWEAWTAPQTDNYSNVRSGMLIWAKG